MSEMCGGCVGLLARVRQLEQKQASFAHLPAWWQDVSTGVKELQAHCEKCGVTVEQFYAEATCHNPNKARDAVVGSLAAAGWTASRIALIARMSERAVRRVMSRGKQPTKYTKTVLTTDGTG